MPIPIDFVSSDHTSSSTYSSWILSLRSCDHALHRFSPTFSVLCLLCWICQPLNTALSQGLGHLLFSVHTLILGNFIYSHGLEQYIFYPNVSFQSSPSTLKIHTSIDIFTSQRYQSKTDLVSLLPKHAPPQPPHLNDIGSTHSGIQVPRSHL